MASLGSAALVVAWLAALYMVAAAFFGARSGRHAYVVSARRATYALTGLLVLAFGRARGTDPRSEPPLRRRGWRGPSADRRRLGRALPHPAGTGDAAAHRLPDGRVGLSGRGRRPPRRPDRALALGGGEASPAEDPLTPPGSDARSRAHRTRSACSVTELLHCVVNNLDEGSGAWRASSTHSSCWPVQWAWGS